MNHALPTPEPIADSGGPARPATDANEAITPEPDAETFEETCARLWITIDNETGGSEIIFASKQLAAKLQKQSSPTEKKS